MLSTSFPMRSGDVQGFNKRRGPGEIHRAFLGNSQSNSRSSLESLSARALPAAAVCERPFWQVRRWLEHRYGPDLHYPGPTSTEGPLCRAERCAREGDLVLREEASGAAGVFQYRLL